METSLQAVDPSVSVPYWDYTVDGQRAVDAAAAAKKKTAGKGTGRGIDGADEWSSVWADATLWGPAAFGTPSADRLKRVKMYPEGSPPLVPRVAFQVRHPECERVPLLSAAECC